MSVSPALEPVLDSSRPSDERTSETPGRRFDPRDIDWSAVWAHPLTVPGLLVFAGLVLAFWPMIRALPVRWNQDEYYSHGWLVPALSGFIIFRRWSKIQAIVGQGPAALPGVGLPIKILGGVAAALWTGFAGIASYVGLNTVLAAVGSPLAGAIGLLVLAIGLSVAYGLGMSVINRFVGFQTTALGAIVALLPLVYISYLSNIVVLQSVLFVAVAILAAALVAGWRWALALTPGIAFLLFGFPVWNSSTDGYTNPLQLASTSVAYELLQATGFRPLQTDPTTIYLNNFQLNVAVPCSGMKLMLAVSAFTTLFVLIANLRLWSNVFMFALIVPLCLFVNGLRIALIGIVGNEYGQEAGMRFHDYSGYITLVACFFLLFKFARLLGWKD